MVQAVSAAFTNASLNSNTMIPVVSVVLNLLDNQSISANITPSATSTADASLTPASKGVNGITVPDKKWAFADPFASIGTGGRCLADGSVYPMDPNYEAGWWGATLSDNSGNVTSTTFTITYASGVNLSSIYWYADSYLGYPVNFTIDYSLNGSTWTNSQTVTGNAATSAVYSVSLTGVLGIRITITNINYAQMHPVLLEFGGGLVVDATSITNDFNVLMERSTNTATLEVGNASANSTSLNIDNTDGKFSPNRSSSPYYGTLRHNRKITYKVGFQGTELIPFGTFYSMNWNAPLGGPNATVRGQDRMKKLRDKNYETGTVAQNQTVDQLIATACQAAGLGVNEYIANPTSVSIPYAWPNPTESYFKYLTDLAAAAGGVVYFDENNRLIFQDVLFLHNNSVTPVMTLTDSNAIITLSDEWNEGEIKNKISVQVNPLKLQSSGTIWNLQTGTTLTVPAGGTLNVTVNFSGPALSTAVGTLTASPATVSVSSYTPYAASALIVLSNSGGAPATVSVLTITGQLLVADGSTIVIAEDTALEKQDDTRVLSINNRFIQNTSAANAIAANLLTLHKNPPAKVHVEGIALPQLELGDCVAINSTKAGINGNFWLIRHDFAYNGGFKSNMDFIAVV